MTQPPRARVTQAVDYTKDDVSELYSAPDKQFDVCVDCMGTRSE